MAASVNFIHPHDGATVSSPVRMSFAVEGMEVKPAGDTTPDTGHFCLLLDGGPVPQGEIVPATGRAWHFSEGQTSVSLPLPPGRHSLTLQFDDGGHVSYGPNMSRTIIVQVWALHGLFTASDRDGTATSCPAGTPCMTPPDCWPTGDYETGLTEDDGRDLDCIRMSIVCSVTAGKGNCFPISASPLRSG